MQQLHDAGLLAALENAKAVELLRGDETGLMVVQSLTGALERVESKCEQIEAKWREEERKAR